MQGLNDTRKHITLAHKVYSVNRTQNGPKEQTGRGFEGLEDS